MINRTFGRLAEFLLLFLWQKRKRLERNSNNKIEKRNLFIRAINYSVNEVNIHFQSDSQVNPKILNRIEDFAHISDA